jgi:hypothetical protein
MPFFILLFRDWPPGEGPAEVRSAFCTLAKAQGRLQLQAAAAGCKQRSANESPESRRQAGDFPCLLACSFENGRVHLDLES